jgi:hypothetical protein
MRVAVLDVLAEDGREVALVDDSDQSDLATKVPIWNMRSAHSGLTYTHNV